MQPVVQQEEAKPSRSLTLPMSHPTAVIYLDESGVIKTDRFFGIGCLRVVDDARLQRFLREHRQRLECFEEIHWAMFDKARALRGGSYELACAAIDGFFDLEGVSFFCLVADRQEGNFAGGYRTAWEAYERLAARVLDSAIDSEELVSVVADHVDTPRDVRFEHEVKKQVNRSRSRLAVATVTRAHSHAMDGLQLADLLLGATMFDFRRGIQPEGKGTDGQKDKLCSQLLDRCDVPSFRPRGKELRGKFKVEMRRRTRRGRRGRRG
jgi:hypothetical protein